LGKRRDLFECRHRLNPWVIKLINPHPSAVVPAFAVRDFGYAGPAAVKITRRLITLCNQSRNRENLREETLRAGRCTHAVYHRA
jgi:hypothetical protein